MTLDSLIQKALERTNRFAPAAAYEAASSGAILIDTRSHRDRSRRGIIPGSVHIPRTVFEWRLAPESEWRNTHVANVSNRMIVVCNDGYSSLLAASALVDLGYHDAGDVIGGYEAWRADGLPTMAAPEPDPSDQPDGIDPPQR